MMILFVIFQYASIPFTISWIKNTDIIEDKKKGIISVIVCVIEAYLALVAHSIYEKVKKEKEIARTLNSTQNPPNVPT